MQSDLIDLKHVSSIDLKCNKFQQLSTIIKTRATRGLSIENLLGLLIHIYALAGTEIRLPEQQEKQLEVALSEAIHEDSKAWEKIDFDSDTLIDYQSSRLFGGYSKCVFIISR